MTRWKMDTTDRRKPGNLIGESKPDGSFTQEWVYLGSHRLAMIRPLGGGGLPQCGGCSLSGGADGGVAFGLIIGAVFIGIGLGYRNRKFTVAGLLFVGGVLVLVMQPEAKGMAVNEQILYYHNDHLGTPRMLTDFQGTVMWDVDYEPFGKISQYRTIYISGSQPFRFPGQYSDDLTGLYYNWNRYYLPETGMYNRVDPEIIYNSRFINKLSFNDNGIEMDLFENICNCNIIDSQLEPYRYAGNNPVNFIDPDAKLCVPITKYRCSEIKKGYKCRLELCGEYDLNDKEKRGMVQLKCVEDCKCK